MRVAIPHSLGRDEARRRLKSRSHEISGLVPGGIGEIAAHWPSEDRMTVEFGAMGKSAQGSIEIGDDTVVFSIDLPGGLSFVEPMIRSAVEAKVQKLLG
jgi:hypothetical protein